jgi:hypothetical protein
MSLVNPKQYIISARSNGYKDTSYAIAELADNSIQAGASKVEVLLFEGVNRNVETIAIIDNGHGMSKELLASALGFGESGRDKDNEGNLLNDDSNGMGKFGMGLPNASVSQCRRVQVWSWKSLDSIHYSYLDVDEIIDGTYIDLPEPSKYPVDELYIRSMFDGDLPKTGTVVVWSKLDKLKWKRSLTLFEKSEFEIGRMYRRFISKQQCSVQFKVFDKFGTAKKEALSRSTSNSFVKPSLNGIIRANDPLYLSSDTSLKDLPLLHIDESQSFFCEKESYSIPVSYQGKNYSIKVRSSVARQEIIKKILAREGVNKAGDTDYGKHCQKNMGVSVLRADRELEMITNEFFAKGDIYQTRFMGVEIEIPPGLDEVFGVTNNKQHAHHLRDMKLDIFSDGDRLLCNEREIVEHLKSIGEEDTAILFEISTKLNKTIENAKNDVKKLELTKATVKSTPQTEDDKATIALSAGFAKREEDNSGKTTSVMPNYKEFEKTLIEKFGFDVKEAKLEKEKAEALHSIVSIKYAKTSDQSFFEVENLQGMVVLIINPEHEVYKHFLASMSEKDKLLFKVMLGAWARLEDETHIPNRKRQLEKARSDWSSIIEDMFEELELNKGDYI